MKRQIFILCLLATAMSVVSAPNKNKTKITAEQKKEIFDAVKNKRFTFAFGEEVYSKHFKLDRSGKIKGYDNANEKHWDINDFGQLVLYNSAKKVQWRLKKGEKDGQMYFEEPGGRSLLEM
jgi:hypothetical protein